MSTSSASEAINHALVTRRWEIARRLCLRELGLPGLAQGEINRRLHDLHEICQLQGDFPAASSALGRIVPITAEDKCEVALKAALDLAHFTEFSFYRFSDDAKAGHTYEVYQDRLRRQAKAKLDEVLSDTGSTLALRDKAKAILAALYSTHEGLSIKDALKNPLPPPAVQSESAATGSVVGTVRFPDGTPAAHITVTLGLHFERPFPDVASLFTAGMESVNELEPTHALTALTDAQGNYRFDSVPAANHEFLAVTLDPAAYDIPTRFLQHGVQVAADSETRCDLSIIEWRSAPPREVTSPFTERLDYNGHTYLRIQEWTLKNPFHFDFPRQVLSVPLPPGAPINEAALLLLCSVEPAKPLPIQITREGITYFAELPQLSDRVYSLFASDGTIPGVTPAPALAAAPESSGDTAIIDTGVAQFRIAYGNGTEPVPPLLAVRGADKLWRGQGRLVLPEGVAVISRRTEILEAGPLVLTARITYRLSNQSEYAWVLTAHRNEAYLLVREISPALEGAAFDFSLREFSGGRGYLHWKTEGGDKHWSDLEPVDLELARIQESVAWWLPPQGFGYAMTPKNLQQNDYIAVFSRRRGEWIDREFERLCQGPGENRELDWPHPEMVGSTISMMTAKTDTTGDAFFHFGFFDGERQWGILVSDLQQNDGPFKQLSAVQHKNSSPRLQEYKDWNLDVQDTVVRPCLLARRKELGKLRARKTTPVFAGPWERIARGEAGGASAALVFAIDNNPLAGWRKKAELVFAARKRSKMILLGRDFGDAYSPVGARPIAPWAESYDLIAASGCFTPDEEQLVRQFLVLMGHMHMEPDLMNWHFNSRNANFEADRTDAVGTVGLCFPGHPDAKKFIDHCVSLTERSLNVYCTPGSGRWYENPACYYLHASKCRMNLLFHLYHHGIFDATTIPRLKDFLRWGVLLLTPRYPARYAEMREGLDAAAYEKTIQVRRIPPIGDHAHLGSWVPDHYATAAHMYRKSDPEFSDLLLAAFQEGGSDGGYYGCAPIIFCALEEDDFRPVQLPAMPSRKLEGFGAIFREDMGSDHEFYLLLKQGPGGYRYHRTEGSILLFVDGRPLIFDGGEAGDTWRHSTLSFYDARLPLAVGHVERFHSFPGLNFVQGVHPTAVKPGEPIYANDSAHHKLAAVAHARFAEPNPLNVRTVVTVHDEYVILHDDLQLPTEIPCRWHLQVVANGHSGDAHKGYYFQGRFGIDLQVLLPDQVFAEQSVEHLPIHDYKAAPQQPGILKAETYQFWGHPRNVVRPPDECFAMKHVMVRAERPNHYLAVLRPVSGNRPPLAARALLQGNRSAGVAIVGTNVDDHIFLNRESTIVESGGMSFNGRYGAVVRRPNNLRLSLLSGSRLKVDEISILSHGPAVHLSIKPGGVELKAQGQGRFEVKGFGRPAVFELRGDTLSTVLNR